MIENILINHFSVDPDEISPERQLADLGLDSMDRMELLVVCENAYQVKISQDIEANTIADVEKIIMKELEDD